MSQVFTIFNEADPPAQAGLLRAWERSWSAHGWTPRIATSRTKLFKRAYVVTPDVMNLGYRPGQRRPRIGSRTLKRFSTEEEYLEFIG